MTRHQRLLVVRRQFDIDDAIIVISDLEFFVRVNVIVVVVAVLAHLAPYGQIVDVHLIPVNVFDGIGECVHLFVVQFHHTHRRMRNVLCKILCDRIRKRAPPKLYTQRNNLPLKSIA